MERMLLKGLLLIVSIWAIWNSSKVISDVAKITQEDSKSKPKIETPESIITQPDETTPQENGGKFYMRKIENQ